MGEVDMKKSKILATALIFFAITRVNKIVKSQDTKLPCKTPNRLIDETANTITIEVKQSTKELIQILDETVCDGRLPMLRALRGRRRSKKKIKLTANNLEKIIHETIDKIQPHQAIKDKTNKFIAKTKKKVFDMHKQMVAEMRKSIGVKQPEIVTKNVNQAKDKITKFEEKMVLKIAKFSSKLKEGLKSTN